MKKIKSIIVILMCSFLFCAISMAQNKVVMEDSLKKEFKKLTSIPLDTIIKMNGDTLIVNIKYKDFDQVIFIYPFNKQVSKVTIPTISEMRYSDGMVVYMANNHKEEKETLGKNNSTAESLKPDTSLTWAKVKIIYSNKDLPTSAISRGEIISDYTGEFKVTNEELEKRCLAIMQKKAAQMRANYLLIINNDIHREYGELPSIEIKGNIYFVEAK